MYILIYVSDLIVACISEKEITNVKRALMKKLSLSSLGGVISCFQGIRIENGRRWLLLHGSERLYFEKE